MTAREAWERMLSASQRWLESREVGDWDEMRRARREFCDALDVYRFMR